MLERFMIDFKNTILINKNPYMGAHEGAHRHGLS